MASALESLPVELFEIIAVNLDLAAYRHLRLSSRRLHSLSLSTFVQRFFSHLTVTLNSPSLERLVKVSNQNHLSNIVVLLDIKISSHAQYKLLSQIASLGIFPPPKRFCATSGIARAYVDEEAALYHNLLGPKYPQSIVDHLTRALRGFGNLKTIRFRANHSIFQPDRGILAHDDPHILQLRCFQVIFDAILKSEIQLDDFSMARRKAVTARHSKHKHITYLPFPGLHFSTSDIARLRCCFANLQTLKLTVDTSYNGSLRQPGWENDLGNFIMCAPALKHLTLSLDPDDRSTHHSASTIRSLVPSLRLCSLESMQLSNCTIFCEDLIKFTQAHASSLQSLTLEYVKTYNWNWTSFWTALIAVEKLQCVRLKSVFGNNHPALYSWWNHERERFTIDTAKSRRAIRGVLDELVTTCNAEASQLPSGFVAIED